MSRGIRWSILIIASMAVLVVSSAATARPSYVPGGYSKCNVGAGRGYGYSYLTSLYVHHIGCTNGKTVARHHGRGWQCTTKRLDTSPVQYDSLKKCSKGRMGVLWTFTQNT